MAIGAFDSPDICNLIEFYIFDTLKKKFLSALFGLCRDDALVISRKVSELTLDSLGKS